MRLAAPRLAPEWDGRFTRMIGVSAIAHAAVVALAVVLAGVVGSRPLPMTAYTVELTDPAALGGRLPPGPPGRDLAGEAATGPKAGPPAPAENPPPSAPRMAPAEPAKPPEPAQAAKAEPKPEPKPEPAVKLPDPATPPEKSKPEAQARPEPKPEPRPAPKAEPPKMEGRSEPKPPAKTPAQAAPQPPSPPRPDARPAATGAGAAEDAAGQDAYAAAASRWRAREGAGGLGGTEGGSGPIGTGGPGPGGGGQVVGLEFIAYQQQVTNTIKGHWTNVIAHGGLVAKVRFRIATDGAVSDVALAEGSGNAAYDASVLRAVQRANPLPAPPARYVNEFREFLIEFHSEDKGGEGTG